MNSLTVVLNPAEHSRWWHRTVGRPRGSRRSLHGPRSERQWRWWSSVAMHPVGPGLSQQTIGFCTKSSKRAESQDILSRSPGRFRLSAGCRLSLCTLGPPSGPQRAFIPRRGMRVPATTSSLSQRNSKNLHVHVLTMTVSGFGKGFEQNPSNLLEWWISEPPPPLYGGGTQQKGRSCMNWTEYHLYSFAHLILTMSENKNLAISLPCAYSIPDKGAG